jgi:hypothetical protein
MLLLGGKKKKILDLAKRYAADHNFEWTVYYENMGQLLKR